MVKEELQTNGCYFGHISEINSEIFNKLENLKPLLDREFYTKVTHSYLEQYGDKIESTQANTFIEAETIKNEWLLKKNSGLDVWQIFYTFNNDNDKGSRILQDLLPNIKELFIPIIEYCYGSEILDKIWDINRNVINLTNFTKDCFINNHSDGGSPHMVCNILIYLNENWQEEDGGELVIKEQFKQTPKWGNFAVLDFTKHNPSHLVTSVKNSDSNRFAVLTGVLLKESRFISTI